MKSVFPDSQIIVERPKESQTADEIISELKAAGFSGVQRIKNRLKSPPKTGHAQKINQIHPESPAKNR